MLGQAKNPSREVRYALAVGAIPARALRVVSFRGREALSALYRFDITVLSSLPEMLFNPLVLGQTARLAISVSGSVRLVHGIICRVRQETGRHIQANAAHKVHQYRLRLVPRAWLLRRRKGSFIHQHKRIDEVITGVAKAVGMQCRWDLKKELPKRDYCTQFEETDFAFIRRLSAENGIFFYFDQSPVMGEVLEDALALADTGIMPPPLDELGDLRTLLTMASPFEAGDVMVFSDRAHYPPAGRSLSPPSFEISWSHDRKTADQELLTDASLTHRVVPTGAIYREYDWHKPLSELETTAGDAKGAGTVFPDLPGISLPGMPGIPGAPSVSGAPSADGMPSPPDVPSGPGMPSPPGVPSPPGMPSPPGIGGLPGGSNGTIEGPHIYEHDGRDTAPDWERMREEPQRILHQHVRREAVLRGTSDVVHLEAGRSFHVDSSRMEHAAGDYVATDVVHVARPIHDESHEPTYENRVGAVPADVIYLPKRPRRRSVQVCMTALVVGPKGEEIHVNDRGEIRVKFYWDRRPDRTDPTCWVRTMHPWAGVGWGFQHIPRIGMEVVVTFEGGDPDRPLVLGTVYNKILPPPFSLPEQKTRSGIRTNSTPRGAGHNELSFEDAVEKEQVYLRAQRDFDSLVRHDRTATIEHQDKESVVDNQYLSVGGEQEIRITKKRDAHLQSDDLLHVEGDRHVVVDKKQEERFGSRTASIAKDDSAHVGGNRDLVVDGGISVVSSGSATVSIGTAEKPRSMNAVVAGQITGVATGGITLVAEEAITLAVGQSYIRIGKKQIEISSEKVEIRGKDARAELSNGKFQSQAKETWQAVSDDALLLKSSGAGMALQSEARVDGSQILLNSPAKATDSASVEEPEPTEIEAVDQDGEPAAYQRYIIRLDSGEEVTGFLDADGRAKVMIEGGGEVLFPDLNRVEES